MAETSRCENERNNTIDEGLVRSALLIHSPDDIAKKTRIDILKEWRNYIDNKRPAITYIECTYIKMMMEYIRARIAELTESDTSRSKDETTNPRPTWGTPPTFLTFDSLSDRHVFNF